MYRTMKKRTCTSAFKTKVVLEALSERFTIQELAKSIIYILPILTIESHIFLSIANGVFDKPIKDAKTEAHQKEEHVYLRPADNGLEYYKGLRGYFLNYYTQKCLWLRYRYEINKHFGVNLSMNHLASLSDTTSLSEDGEEIR